MGVYKCQGKAKRDYFHKKHLFLVDRYKEQGVVCRYIEVGKQWILEEYCNDKGMPQMHGAYEKLEGIEIARTYFEPGKKMQTDFNKHDPYKDEDFWDDCNLYGLSNVSIKNAIVHPDTWENIKNTEFQYCAMKEYSAAVYGDFNAKDYLMYYQIIPQIEMLVKMGLIGVVREILAGNDSMIEDRTARRMESFLGIKKERISMLVSMKGKKSLLEVLKMEKELEQNWSEEQILCLEEIKAGKDDIAMVLQVISLQKILNAIKKYAGCEYGTECTGAKNRLIHIATTYFDYLSMRRNLGYDLTNTVYQRPRNLEEAHNQMVMEQDKEKIDKRFKEVAEKFPEIRKQYRKLRNRYFYEDEEYIIRPARSAEEIVTEGRILHHCVGGDGYLTKHNKGISVILLLRNKKKQDNPYITVEIEKTRIIQWYGKNDKKPDEENMNKWLKNYTKWLREKPSLKDLKMA